MQDYFFSVQKMTVGYDGIPLIKNIEIRIKKGEILTLIGPNGAGKSTILKSIIGQLPLISGTVLLKNVHLNEISEKELAKNLSVVLTDRIYPELLTVRDIVGMGRYPYTGKLGVLSKKDKEFVNTTMELVHISDLAENDFSSLSDGQKQKVMLAKALAQEPEILILDEPTSFLDIRCQLEFLSIIKNMTREKQLTVVMSMHDLDMAEWISDKVMCVKGEYVEGFGNPQDIFTPDYISEFYGISKEDLKMLGRWRVK